jgi:hypothetical protein
MGITALFVAAAAFVPWAHPLAFQPLAGWTTGASGNVSSLYGPAHVRAPKESAAWIARNVRYRDQATADPPDKTLMHLPANGIVVWAVIFQGLSREHRGIVLRLSRATHFSCCEGVPLRGGEYELHGYGPNRAYTVYVRIYFGSPPNAAMRAQAQHALNQLKVPWVRPS